VNFKQAILWPLTLPYGAANYLRAAAYRSAVLAARRLDGVVVSVGNLTVGGTGKTPIVAALAEHLIAEGKRVGILTRGYRGERSIDGNATSDEVELLRARLGDKVDFGVGADRFARGQELVRRGVEWFLLDDGFQHQQLVRDVDIVLIDATNPFGGGQLLPAGRLREPRSALGRADIVIITRSERAPALEAAIAHYTKAPIFYSRAQLDFIQAITGGSGGGLMPGVMAMEMRRCFVFCGIGNPAAFVSDVRGWGFPVVGQKFFRDHHRYTQADVEAIEREASAAGARELLCTEKDRFNLAGVHWAPASDVSYCRISMRMERETQFWDVLEATAKRKHAAR
jgi:tetraacyldisaccharide 4'-kinase